MAFYERTYLKSCLKDSLGEGTAIDWDRVVLMAWFQIWFSHQGLGRDGLFSWRGFLFRLPSLLFASNKLLVVLAL